MSAVKLYSTYLVKYLVRKRLTILPMSVAVKRRASMFTYSRSRSVEMIDA